MVKKKKKKPSSNSLIENNEIRGIFAIALGIIFSIAMFHSSGGSLIVFIRGVLIALIGIGGYLIPFYLIFYGFALITKKKLSNIIDNRFYFMVGILINTLAFIQLINNDLYFYDGFSRGLSILVKGQETFHGGILGMIISYPIYKLLGVAASYVLYIAVYIVALIIVFDFSLYDIGSNFKSKVNSNIGERKSGLGKNKGDVKPVIEAENNNLQKEDFLNGVNNKIKILDFMKNSSILDEEALDKKEESPEMIIDGNNSNNESKRSNKKKGNIEESIKEEISHELNSKLVTNNFDEIEYKMPSLEFLNENTMAQMNKEDKKELLTNASKLEETLNCFGVEAKVLQVIKGPSVTRFELQPSAGVKVSKIVNLSDDIALSLAARGVRIEAPIPGKSAVGIEVPNKELTPVFLREVIQSEEFENTKKNLAFSLGKDIGGKCVVADLTKMPHLLIAGATGSGKSVCINTLVISILYKYSPEEVKLLMIDPKVVELNVYNGIPHLLIPVVTDPKKAAAALNWAVNEMTRRYKLFADNGVRNVEGFNDLYEKGKIDEKLPWIVIVVDELADLMMVCPRDVEEYIARLAQMARAAGMHLVIATQRPSVDVITGVIKANIPSRISFAVSSQVDSRTIIDSAGAEKLLGKGDMLFYPVGQSKPVRIQGAFISEEEVEKVVDFIKVQQDQCQYEEEIIEHINNESMSTAKGNDSEGGDALIDEAVKVVVESGQASTSLLQRRLRIGFNRAARIMEELEEMQIISPRDGSKPRQVLISKDEINENYN
ncbi:FtsK/SpoIIIE family DNA translocase [Clostridium frigidicarnis]|uniref:DNA translocase FtsK n=1 Tax=Clostridium frigidicarnis TaxID=84698 RepID=A0A1I0WNA5_9CLOT|nr:DNA translocase FtsK [Clostridium frigidicarnis]SFA89446.1 DNA translocase FtsK [Clostridium frigidicarnis]